MQIELKEDVEIYLTAERNNGLVSYKPTDIENYAAYDVLVDGQAMARYINGHRLTITDEALLMRWYKEICPEEYKERDTGDHLWLVVDMVKDRLRQTLPDPDKLFRANLPAAQRQALADWEAENK